MGGVLPLSGVIVQQATANIKMERELLHAANGPQNLNSLLTGRARFFAKRLAGPAGLHKQWPLYFGT